MTASDFKERQLIAQREPWAKASLDKLISEADAFPASYKTRFGLHSTELPPEGGQWIHWYVCPDTGTPLSFRPPNHNVCPDTGKEFSGFPYDQVVYQLRNDALRRVALTLALAYRFTNKERYAKEAVSILTAYADRYKDWPLHDMHGKPTPNGAKAYAQTLDESIWLIDISWTYDLVRGSGLLDDKAKTHIENDLLRASYQTVSKAHKEPTDNIQSWINAAIAAVGYTLHDSALVSEALDGPIGFRYQMKHFVHQGFWIEGAFGYHFYALRALVATAQMAKCAGQNLWKEEPALLSLFTGPTGIVLPNGQLPAFNDSNPTDLFAQDYLYEQAYAASDDPLLLPIVSKYGRTSREALLFGKEHIPTSAIKDLKSVVYAEAGYAALRNKDSDLTVIAKFGEHGGAHGHYDKLSFVLYSQGHVLGVDPGTQLYGLPLHKQWDSMTIAHNTISVDEKRQAASTGRLLSWKVGPDWTAVTMDAGPVYADVSFQRTIALTSKYVLISDQVKSRTNTPHNVDWIYHNHGQLESEQPSAATAVSNFSAGSGYELLKELKKVTVSSAMFRAHFTDDSTDHKQEEPNSNSPPATTRSGGSMSSKEKPGVAELDLSMPISSADEVFSGVAPGHDLKRPVPFVLARKRGSDITFTAVLSPEANVNAHESTTSGDHAIVVEGSGVSDRISFAPTLDVQHHAAAH